MKRSFTSSSKRRVCASLIVLLVTFAIVVVAGQKLGTLLGKFHLYFGKRVMEDLPAAYTLPDQQDWYIAYDEFGLDHYILYHGLGKSIQYAREADVLLLGNSRVAYGFSKTVLKEGKLKTRLMFYNLGFGYDEGSKLALALIEKHDLRPRIVVANAAMGQEDHFFRPRASEFGQKVMESSRWEARKTVWEWKLTWRVRHSGLLERLPDWRELRPPFRIWVPRFIYCRSISTGSWGAYREKPRPVPVGTPPADVYMKSDSVDNATLFIARNFKQALADRGTQLVLTWVPWPRSWHNRREAASLAAALDVPFISPVVEGLVARDGCHLDDESAERFGVRFLKDFDAWLKESASSNKH